MFVNFTILIFNMIAIPLTLYALSWL